MLKEGKLAASFFSFLSFFYIHLCLTEVNFDPWTVLEQDAGLLLSFILFSFLFLYDHLCLSRVNFDPLTVLEQVMRQDLGSRGKRDKNSSISSSSRVVKDKLLWGGFTLRFSLICCLYLSLRLWYLCSTKMDQDCGLVFSYSLPPLSTCKYL